MSLGLVSYDDSDESDNESDTDTNATIVENKRLPPSSDSIASSKASLARESKFEKRAENTDIISVDEDTDSPRIRNSEESGHIHLPESRVGLSLLNTDIDIKFLTSANKKPGPVKITIPSLSEVEEGIDEPLKKKIKPSQKGSGLFALLPNPKNSLVPQSVANRNKATSNKSSSATAKPSKPLRRAPVTSRPATTTSLTSYEDSEDEEDAPGTVDFFSLEGKEEDITPAPVDIDLMLPEEKKPAEKKIQHNVDSNKALSFSKSFQPSKWLTTQPSVASQPEASSAGSSHSAGQFGYSTAPFMTVSNADLELDQEAMQQLCGRRDRLKMGEVSLIDVSGDTLLPDSREWLTKQLTEEPVHRSSHKRNEGPTSQQKRKHQITYLAYQAKENELELKNQWANNRMSRKQTQAKYGF